MEYTKQQLWDQYKKLPEDIQEMLFSINYANAIEKIGTKNRLHVDQLDVLANEIGLILLGLARPDDFLKTIQTKLNIPIEVAGEIVKQANTDIFFLIRESLKRVEVDNARKAGEPDAYVAERAPKVEPIRENVAKTQSEPIAVTVNQAPKTQSANLGQAMFEQKMGNLFHLEKEEKDVSASIANNTGSANSFGSKPVDPYHEQIQ